MKTIKAVGYAVLLTVALAVLGYLRWYERCGGRERYAELARPAEVSCEHWYIGWRGER